MYRAALTSSLPDTILTTWALTKSLKPSLSASSLSAGPATGFLVRLLGRLFLLVTHSARLASPKLELQRALQQGCACGLVARR